MSALWGQEEFTQEKFDKQQQKTEELVAECMAKEGFEYTPNTNNGGVMMSSDDEGDGPEWGSVEFAEQYGYGVVDFPGRETMTESPTEYTDPNQEYTDGLSPSEQTAYWETLNGPGPTDEEMAAMEEGDGSYEYDWKTAGCYGAAQHEVSLTESPAAAAQEDPEFADMFAAMQDLYGPLNGSGDNAKLAEIDRKWADCMADAGFSEYPSPNEVMQSMHNEYSELSQSGPDGEYKEPDAKAQKEFQEREISTAVADAQCKKDLGYDAKQREILFEIEQQFVDEYRAKLDALVAKYGAEKK